MQKSVWFRAKSVLYVSAILLLGGFLFSLGGGVNTAAAAVATKGDGGGWTAGHEATVTKSELSGTTISEVITIMMRWLLYLVGFFAVIAFVISGILYLTAAGDDDRIERAKTTMIYAIIGVIVALMGLIIINAVSTWFGGTSATF